ncbi:hypothetical protein D1BOALGB6SA_7446 [Olavius sp. associated proteobacterium Delta 1]|nr:hypothetical protein D1BOALGB6SA_7446 [Olavius sp. associated proteobacterium Delta 1]
MKDIGSERQDGVIDNFEKLVLAMRNYQDRSDKEKRRISYEQ